MSEVERNLFEIKESLKSGVELVAVSKFQADEKILEAYSVGQRVFAESRPQELKIKYDHLPKDIEWHFIGHLQTNKVKDVVGKVQLIQSVDSLHLLEAINKESERQNIVSNVLLEVFVAQEESKQGFLPTEIMHLFESKELEKYANTKICGLMAMASYTDNESQVRDEFLIAKKLFDQLGLEILSMGMSGDYKIAIDCGATMIRVGSKIFGERIYL